MADKEKEEKSLADKKTAITCAPGGDDDHDYTFQDLLNITGRFGSSVSRLENIVGITAERVNKLEREEAEHWAAFTAYRTRNDTRWETHDDNERIDGVEAKRILESVRVRVAMVLSLGYDVKKKKADKTGKNYKYFGGFCQRLWNDLKKETGMPPEYRETKRKDYEAVMKFIDSWFPVCGVEGYKAHLDVLEEERRRG